jgi:hypothetical protein
MLRHLLQFEMPQQQNYCQPQLEIGKLASKTSAWPRAKAQMRRIEYLATVHFSL